MERNLEKRGLQLPGLVAAESAETQKNRFTEAGWEKVSVKDMDSIYKNFDVEDRKRYVS